MSRKSKPVVLAIAQAYVGTMVDALTHASAMATIYSEEKTSINETIRAAICTMRESATDTGEYLTACEYAHGNGLRHTAKDYKPGALRERLTDAGIALDSVKVYMAKARAVANWLADPVNWEKRNLPSGKAVSLDGLYKMATLKANPAVGDTPAPAPASTSAPAPASVSQYETVSQFIARVGILVVLAECARILRTDRKSADDGKTIAAVVEHAANWTK